MAPKCFQSMNLFVSCLSILLFVDLIAGVYFRSVLTTIERRFELSATKLALLSSTYQVGNLAVMAFVSYYGSRTHRTRFIAAGAGLVAAGYLIASLPQFLGGRYEYADTVSNTSSSASKRVQTCDAQTTVMSNATTCESMESESNNNLYILIAFGLTLSGIGDAPLQPLGMSYIDDNSHPRKSPVYVGITMTVAIIGPVFGFLIGATILTIWVDAGWIDTAEVKITPQNPGWVGAWWIGLLATGFLIALASIPLWFFPKKMKRPKTDNGDFMKSSHENASEHHTESDSEKNEDDPFKVSAKKKTGILRAAKSILTNATFLMIMLMWIFSAYNVIAEFTFFPKFLEAQFGVSASKANMYFGGTGIPALAVGTMVGSYLMKRLNLDRYGIVKLLFGTRLSYTLLIVGFIFLGCETIDIAGVTKPYADSNGPNVLSPLSACNTDCNCVNGTFTPVCGADGLTYLSPCHAGCTGAYSEIPGITQNYTSCSCVSSQSSGAGNQSSWSYPGRCKESKCGDLLVFVLIIRGLANLVGGIGSTPSYLFLMRSVGKKEKAFAIGLAFIIIRFLGWIPAPLLFGKVIDSTCIYWAYSPCGGTGYCLVYDMNKFRTIFFAISVGAETLSCICTFFLCVMTKRQMRTDSAKYRSAAAKAHCT